MVLFEPGKNHLEVIAEKDGAIATDAIALTYQTNPWDTPAQMALAEIDRDDETVTVGAKVLDADRVLGLDARNTVCFVLTGDGSLIDNLGTSTGSRTVQLYNGRAQISVGFNGGPSVLSVAPTGLPTRVLPVQGKGLL
jgi:beta-galactosidase